MKRIKKHIISIFLLTFFVGSSIAQNVHQCTLDCSPHPWSYRLFISPLSTNLTSNQFQAEEKAGLGYNFGGDLVYTFYKKNKLGLNASLGFGITNYNNSRKGDYHNELWTSEYEQVLNGTQTFYLNETAKGIVEKQHMTFLDIPVKVGIDYLFSTKWAGFATFGMAYGFNLGATYSSTAKMTRTGFYPDYNALIFDVDVPGSPYFYPTNKSVSGSGKINAQSNFGLEATAGAKYKLNNAMSLYAGVKWMNGLNDVTKANVSTILANSATSMNTLASRNDNIETRALGIEVGVQINLGNCSMAAKTIEITGSVFDNKTATPLIATLSIKNNGKLIQSVSTDKNGKYKVKIPSNQIYETEISMPGYTTQLQKIDLIGVSKSIKKDFGLNETPKTVSLSGKINNATTFVPTKAKLIIKSNGEVLKTVDTDSNGQFNVDLPKGKKYDVEVMAPGYTFQNKNIDLTGDNKVVQTDFSLIPVKQNVTFTGIATDTKTKLPIKATVAVKLDGQIIKTIETDNNGSYSLDIPKGKMYDIEVLSSGYAPQQQRIDLTSNDADIQKDFSLNPEIQGVQLFAKAVDGKTGEPIAASMIVKNNDMVIGKVNAAKDGVLKIDVPEGKSYEIEVTASGYVPQRQIIDLKNVARGVKKEVTLNPIIKIEKGLVFKFKNVNFNTGTAELTPEALIVLNMVSNILNENPKLQIEISGHTDNVGNPTANMDLSNRRAKAVMNYLVSKGAKPEQMKAFGFGQTKWISTNKTAAGRSENRRVEFKVVNL